MNELEAETRRAEAEAQKTVAAREEMTAGLNAQAEASRARRDEQRTQRAGYWASAIAAIGVVAVLMGGTFAIVRVNNENNTARIAACASAGGQWVVNPYTHDFECSRGATK